MTQPGESSSAHVELWTILTSTLILNAALDGKRDAMVAVLLRTVASYPTTDVPEQELRESLSAHAPRLTDALIKFSEAFIEADAAARAARQ